jgi:hypothetical protein
LGNAPHQLLDDGRARALSTLHGLLDGVFTQPRLEGDVGQRPDWVCFTPKSGRRRRRMRFRLRARSGREHVQQIHESLVSRGWLLPFELYTVGTRAGCSACLKSCS